jgi:hypothetical protein
MINAKRKDTNYLLPPKLYKLKDIINLERNISNHKKVEKEIKASIYKFNEKRSLIEYYKSFYKNIKEGTIYNYFDMKKEYYNDEDWLVKINQLLKRFSKEIEIYLANMGVEL